MKVIATVHYRCETCGSIGVQHTHNRLNAGCCGCGGTVEFESIAGIYTKEDGGPWVEVEGEEMLKLLIFKMLPDPPKPALASEPP